MDETRQQAMAEALRFIEKFRDGRWCERLTQGSCISDPGLTVNAPYGADQWCDACIAHAALNGIELRLFRPDRCPSEVWAELNRTVGTPGLSDAARRWLTAGTVDGA